MYIFRTYNVDERILKSYYEGWKSSGYDIDVFRSLLKSRG